LGRGFEGKQLGRGHAVFRIGMLGSDAYARFRALDPRHEIVN
jgi:hypothetical protein